MHGLQMCVRKISGFVLLWGLTCSSLLRSQIFYVYRPRPPAFRYVPIVRGSGVSEQGVPLFARLSLSTSTQHPVIGAECRGYDQRRGTHSGVHTSHGAGGTLYQAITGLAPSATRVSCRGFRRGLRGRNQWSIAMSTPHGRGEAVINPTLISSLRQPGGRG